MNDKLITSKADSKSREEANYDYRPIAMVFIGLPFFIIFLRFTYTVSPEELSEYWATSGGMGSFVGGIAGPSVSLAAFIYLYLSFKKQRESNQTQLQVFNYEKIETRFFELVKLHRDNVKEMTFTFFVKYKYENGKAIEKIERTIYHRHVFYAIVRQFDEAVGELNFLFENNDIYSIYEDSYLEKLQKNETLINRKIDILLYAKIDLIYLIIFFGVAKEGKSTIMKIVTNKYQNNFVYTLINVAALKPKMESKHRKKWIQINNLNNGELTTRIANEQIQNKCSTLTKKYYYPDHYEKYYGGHQFRLGHYFRHLFQTVNFINDQKSLSTDERYSYVKLLRGQLSNYEQILFFFNSLSQLGRVWEFEDKITGGVIPLDMQLVTNYEIIKNIPNDRICIDIRFSDFYPEINFEGSRVKD